MKKYLLVILAVCSVVANAQNKSFISHVFDFLPAPGQFVNTLPIYSKGEPRDSVLARVLSNLTAKVEILYDWDEVTDEPYPIDTIIHPISGDGVSLGGFGGYVVFGFDHPVVNVEDEYDIQIVGNSMDVVGGAGMGSSEPGIVMVSEDVNGNGIPDDPWYELAGSEYYQPTTQHGYQITYYKPDENKIKVPDPQNVSITDMEYIAWTSNSIQGEQHGYVKKNAWHNQSYWPQWVDGDSLTFIGTKLRSNVVSAPDNGVGLWLQEAFDWGYVDNKPDYRYDTPMTDSIRERCNIGFKLDWAVDADGNPAKLRKADFFKVYCAMNQDCGILGETSTEVFGAIDLHPDAPIPDEPAVTGDINGDSVVDVGDVNMLINMMLGKVDKTAQADVTGDGVVDVSDVNVIINLMLGKQ